MNNSRSGSQASDIKILFRFARNFGTFENILLVDLRSGPSVKVINGVAISISERICRFRFDGLYMY